MPNWSRLLRACSYAGVLLASACSPARLSPPALEPTSEREAAACSTDAFAHDQTALPAPGTLRLLEDPSQLCMLRDHFMGRPELPVALDGRTYYGCCEGCRNRLAHDPAARAAVDPVSHRAIDKALAVVGIDARGAAFYFESEANLRAYAREGRN